ncbi:cadherin-related family member 5 isoform X4 [Alligator mississippiensis]|uniref:Cadherin-related family member 5 isoform C n=1 Tax=Alligator mississippiensis TaxID=8496 RepID=A0A151NXC2_ALLMI|nr:cadherin-related family member 5 isoform X4 [Alligator mississippiensis]KYO41541.1 cadherin-related family member 5 isoform C [Alligator mississippiensis]
MAVSHRLSAYVLFLLLPLIQSQGCSVNNAKPLVRENNSAGLVVTNITKAAGITVTISPTADGNCFSIRDTELILSCSLDYEKQDIYILTLLCTQGNVQVDSLEVIVTVVNLNDNSPVFKQPNFTVNVPEDTRVNAIVLSSDTVSATDLDQDTIYYELRGTTPEATEFFNIQGVNNPGIYLLKALDYDKNKSMQLVLLARDRAPGSVDTNTANATITINIQQADTKPPWFLPCKPVAMSSKVCLNTGYIGRINISEQTMEPLNLKPGPLYAIDPDYTLNEKIVYSIIEGNTDDVFLLNYDTGNLTMNKAVNTPETFILHVMATQANSIEKYALTTVEIKVINRSIHAPYFEHVNYTGTVSTGLIRNSLVMEAGAPSKPLKIFAADDDFPNKINPHITYSIQNSSDFTVTQDGLVLTNSVLSSAMKITMLATAIDLASLQEASTIITIEVIPPKDVNKMSDYKYTAQDMGILGGTLAALLILALFFLGFIFYKVHRNSVTTISKRKLLQDSFRSNDSYQDDEENPARSTGESELPRSNSSSNASPALQKHSESFQPLETMIASSLGATSATVNKEQEEKDKGAHDTDNEKEVKSILTKDRKPANDGYKAVWFNPDAKEEVMVIEDAPEEEEDGNDRDRNEGKENRDDDDNDDSNNQDSHPGDPVVSFIPLRANYGTPDQDTTTGGEGENILL